jgi:MFS family permease
MTPSSIVRAYLAVSGLFTLSASVIWGVSTLFLLEAGLDIFEVFVANAAFTAAMVAFEIPTGVVADTSGRRRSFLLSVATLAAGTLGYVAVAALGGGLLWFVLRRLRQPADVIVGRRADIKGPCAGQGLPVAASVDPLPRYSTPS